MNLATSYGDYPIATARRNREYIRATYSTNYGPLNDEWFHRVILGRDSRSENNPTVDRKFF